MAANETLYDHFADRAALEDEKKFALGIFNDIKDGILGLNKLGFQLDSSKGMADLKAALAEVAAMKAQIQKNNDQLATSQQKINDLQAESAKKAKENSDALKDQTQALKDQAAAVASAAADSRKLIDLSVQLAESQRAITAERKRLRDEFDAGRLGIDDFNKQLGDLKESELQIKDASADVNTALKRITDEANNSEGSLNKLRAELQLMTATFDRLGESERNSAEGQELQKKIAESVKNISELEQATGRFQRNVGNYAGSLAGGFKSIADEIDKLKQKQQGLQNLSASNPIGFKLQGGQDNLNQTTASIQRLEHAQQIGFKTNQSYTQTVRQLQNAYVDLAHDGNVSSEFLKQFKEFVAEAQHSTQELRTDIKQLGSETRTFDLLAGAVSTAATGFEVFNAVQALSGEKNEDVEKSIKKLIAIQSIANGVREVARQITEKETLAGKAYAFVQKQIEIATDNTASATARFSAAFKATVIGLAIAAIVYVIANLNKLIGESKRTEKAIKDLGGVSNETKEALKQYGETIDDIANGSIKDLQSEVDNLNQKFGATPTAIQKARAALQLIDKDLEETKKKAGNLSFLETFFTGLGGLQQAVAIGDKLEKLNAQKKQLGNLAEQQQILKAFDDLLKGINQDADSKIREADLVVDANQRILSSEKATLKERVDAIDENAAKRQAIIQQNLRKELTTTFDTGEIKALQAKAAKDSELAERDHQEQLLKIKQQYADRIAKAGLAAKTSELNDIIALNQRIIDEEKAPATDRLVALSEYTQLKLRIITLGYDQELKKTGLTAEEVTAIEAKKQSDILALYREVNAKKEAIITDFSEKEKEILDKLEGRGISKSIAGFINTDEANQKFADATKQKEDAIKRLKEEVINLGKELTELAFDIAEGNIDQQLEGLQKQNDLIESNKQKQLDALSQLNIADKDRAEKQRLIEANAAQQQLAIQNQQRRLERQKAVLDKEKSIASIIENTAVAVTSVLSIPIYGEVLAVVIAAIGAAQLAKVLATPIPAYKVGTTYAQKGIALTGEEGFEIVKKPSGRMYMTNDGPSLTKLEGGETIYPHDVSKRMIAEAEKSKSRLFNSVVIPVSNNRELIEKQEQQIDLLKRIEKKPAMHIGIYDNSAYLKWEEGNTQS